MTKRIGILTSSRADYGIYRPLIDKLRKTDHELVMIVFGMHLLEKYGRTIDEIKENSINEEIISVKGLQEGDDAKSNTRSYSKLIDNFIDVWEKNHFDIVLALGDRFEMSAAVQSSIAFGITLAHIHGGETTLGATDNIYRHQISLASKLHFVATEQFAERVKRLLNIEKNIYAVGSISLDGIEDEVLPEWSFVCRKFEIPEDKEFVLVTVHPETVNPEINNKHSTVILESLVKIAEDFHIVITLPNADIASSIYRSGFLELKEKFPDSFSLIENFGRLNYFAAMKNSRYLLGNTSSGIIEAASFSKWVVNLGDRQKGRLQSNNILNVDFQPDQIANAHYQLLKRGDFEGDNVYCKKDTVNKIIKLIDENI